MPRTPRSHKALTLNFEFFSTLPNAGVFLATIGHSLTLKVRLFVSSGVCTAFSVQRMPGHGQLLSPCEVKVYRHFLPKQIVVKRLSATAFFVASEHLRDLHFPSPEDPLGETQSLNR